MHGDVARELIAFEWLQKHFICTVSPEGLTPHGVSACCCITTVALETRLCKHGEFSREPKLHPSAKLAERWETNKITDGRSWGSVGAGGSDAGLIFPQFYSAEAQMSDADVFSDSRTKPFQERLDWMKAEPPGLICSPRKRLTRQRCFNNPTENRSLIGLLDASPSWQPFYSISVGAKRNERRSRFSVALENDFGISSRFSYCKENICYCCII